VLKAPLHGVYGWAFKTPIISEFIALSICFLLGFSIVEIFLRIEAHKFKRIRLKRGLGLLMICFLLISILLPKWPLATGDLNNHLIPHEMPDEFSQVNSWLEEQEEDFNVLWLPVYRSTNVDWYQNVTIGKDIAGLSSSKPTYVFWSPQLQPNTYGIYFLTCSTFYGLAPDSMIITNTTKNLGKLLAPLGIKYILFHDDNATYYNSEELRNQSDILLSQLKQQEDLKLVREYGFISVFENTYLNNKQSSCLFTTSDDFLVFGGLASLSTLSFIPSYKTEADGLLFGNQRWYNTKELNETVSGLIFTKSSVLDDIAMLFIDNKYLIAPYDYSERGIPQDTWAAVKLGHPSDRRIHMTFENLEEYDWVYDKGFVCTTSSGLLKTGAVVNDQDLLANYLFETDINDFSSLSANLSISLCYDSAIGRGSLMGIITQGTSQENQIASTTLKAIPNGVRDYRISFYLMTENASNSQVRVRFFDEEKNYINQYFLLTENGNSTFQQCEQDIHIPYNATYYDIQILANQNPITESRWWIDDIKIYDLKNYIEPNILNMDFMANTTDTYDVYMRYLKAWNGGKINLYVDNQLRSSLDTIGNSDTFIWEKITSLQLQKGSHTIAIENVDGCNAVNLIAMIPQNITTKYFEKAEEFIFNKEFIYTLEAESDFFSENATVSALYANNVSSGNVLDLSNNNSKAWIPLQIPQVGNYSLMIRYGGGDANYTLNLTIGDKYYQLGYTNESEFTWVNKTNISLTNGSQDLKFIVQPTTILSSLSFDEGWNSTTNTPEPWSSSSSQPQFTASLDTLNKTDGENSLKLTTNSTKVKKWSQINSKEIPVEANHYYQAQIDIKTENMNNTQVKIQGYNITSEKWEEITYLAITLGGTQDWKKYSRSFFISENISKIRIIINAGWVQDPTLGEATSWFDNVRVSLDSAEATNYNIDLVVMYLNKQSQTFEDLFLEQQKVPILNYEKIDATKYKVTITSTEPFTLVFNEAYDDFWIAHIDGIGDVESLPIYGMLNGFYINKTGTFTITLEYKPEQWFNIGAGITVLSIFGSCFGYLIWIKKKNFRKKT
jgi:hypothetical protein